MTKMSNDQEQKVATIHPEVSNFFHTFHSVNQELKEARATISEQVTIIRTQDDQLEDMRDLLRDVSAKSDYYMRLCVEMRTHFVAIQTLAREAEKCFTAGPQRNNGAVDQATIRMDQLANEINKVTDSEKEEMAEKNEKLAVKFDNSQSVEPKTTQAALPPDDKIPAFLSKPMNKIKAGKEWSK